MSFYKMFSARSTHTNPITDNKYCQSNESVKDTPIQFVNSVRSCNTACNCNIILIDISMTSGTPIGLAGVPQLLYDLVEVVTMETEKFGVERSVRETHLDELVHLGAWFS